MKKSTKLIVIGVVSVAVGVIIYNLATNLTSLINSRITDQIAATVLVFFSSFISTALTPFGGCLTAIGVAMKVKDPSHKVERVKDVVD